MWAVGDPSVADVLVLKALAVRAAGLLLVGRGAGTTDVMLWERGVSEPITYTINVTSPAANALLDSETPAVRTFGDAALVSGSTPTMESHQRGIAAAQASLASKKTIDTTRRHGSRASVGGDRATTRRIPWRIGKPERHGPGYIDGRTTRPGSCKWT